MANRVFRGARGRSVAKRQVAWTGSADQGGVAVGAGAKVIVESNATLTTTTIIRVRGLLGIRQTSLTAGGENIGGYGIAIVSDQAFAAGAASLPGPWTDLDYPWVVHQMWAFSWAVADATGREISSPLATVIDNKAMRKVKSGETVVTLAESQAGAVTIMAPFRMLVKLA